MPVPALVVGALWTGARILLQNVWVWVVATLPAVFMHFVVALGFYFVVAQPVTENLVQYAMNQFAGVHGTVLETLYFLNVDNYLSAIFSAYAVRKSAEAGSVLLKARPAAGGGA